MPIWMTHPVHGRTPAVGSEVAQNEKNGWTVDKVVDKPAVSRGTLQETPVETSNTVTFEVKRPILHLPKKRGRPPKGR